MFRVSMNQIIAKRAEHNQKDLNILEKNKAIAPKLYRLFSVKSTVKPILDAYFHCPFEKWKNTATQPCFAWKSATYLDLAPTYKLLQARKAASDLYLSPTSQCFSNAKVGVQVKANADFQVFKIWKYNGYTVGALTTYQVRVTVDVESYYIRIVCNN